MAGDNSGSAQKLAPLDYIMIAIAFVAVIAGVAYFAVKFLGMYDNDHSHHIVLIGNVLTHILMLISRQEEAQARQLRGRAHRGEYRGAARRDRP